jgi:GTP-binding protein
MSSATPKIDSYPFTTLTPNLGVVQTDWAEPFVVADIPGLISGAHKGAGLGVRFLKHTERTRMLIHLIDASSIVPQKPLIDYETINNELTQYNRGLAQKPQIVVLNKLDLPGTEEMAGIFQAALEEIVDQDVLLISAIKGTGITPLISKLLDMLDQADET